MPTARKPKTTSPAFSPAQVAAARAAAEPSASVDRVDWSQASVTPGGGVAATVGALRRKRIGGKGRTVVKARG